MLAAIFNVSSENWTINTLLERDGDVEIEDDINEDEEEDEEKTEKVNTPAENSDIFRNDEENLTISECF